MQTFKITLAVILSFSCGPDNAYETLEADGKAFCQTLTDCESRADPTRYLAECTNKVDDHSDDASAEGRHCAESFADLMHCFGKISCDDYWTWVSYYANINQSVKYPCDDQTDSFLDDCRGTWFAANVKR